MALLNGSLAIGDCFLLKEIEHFGLVLLTIEKSTKGFRHSLFPILLDSQSNGLDKFLNGQVFISSFIDYTNAKGITEGFQVYHFLEENTFHVIQDKIIKMGNLKLNKNYQNITGGAMADTMEEFRLQLNMFSEMFGRNARMTRLKEIIEI
jgi:hypothetical protein